MKNLKKIIATILATTLIMSTNVFAATTTPGSYGAAYEQQLTDAKVPAGMKDMINTFYTQYGMTQSQADTIKNVVSKVKPLVDGKKKADILADTDLQHKLLPIVTTILDAYHVGYNQGTTKGYYDIYDKSTFGVVLSFSLDSFTGAGAIDQSKLNSALDAAVAANGKYDTIIPGTETPQQEPTITPEKDNTASIAIVDAAIAKLDADTTISATDKTAIKAAADLIKKAIGSLSVADYDAAKAAIEALPDSQYKTDLLAALNATLKKVPATLIGGTDAIATTPTTLAKTATNNGNVAVAGLAMIAVAGTVFFVSKKKIA